MAVDDLGHELRKLRLGDGLTTAKVAASPNLLAALVQPATEASVAEKHLREAVDGLLDERQRSAIRNAYAMGEARSRASLGTVERRRRFAADIKRSESSVYGDEERAVETLAATLRHPAPTSGLVAVKLRAEVEDGRVTALTSTQILRATDGSIHDRQREFVAPKPGGNNWVAFVTEAQAPTEAHIHTCFHGVLPAELTFYHYQSVDHWVVHKAEWWGTYEFINENTTKDITFRPRPGYVYVFTWAWTAEMREGQQAKVAAVRSGSEEP